MSDLFGASSGSTSPQGASSLSSAPSHAGDERVVLSVSALTTGLRELVEEAFDDVWVEGELSNFTRASSGHCYFTLTDAEAQIRCVMWRWLAKHVYFQPEDGMQVRVHGFASLYERRGELQIQARSMQRAGEGAMRQAFERLKRQLEAEGLFDDARKKALPALPEVVGVVTSGTGAALHDITSVLARRFPAAHVVVVPVPVQGMDAPPALADALDALGALPEGHPHRPEVVIVGRGGGAAEDLWAFNEEAVARAVARCPLPVVSAVGHETDVAIADFVADARAATPSMAAEIVVPDARAVAAAVEEMVESARAGVLDRVQAARQRVEHLTASRAFHEPTSRLQQMQQRLDDLAGRLSRGARRQTERARARFERLEAQLRALDPQAPLRRGYAWVERNGQAVRAAAALAPGDRLALHFADGARPATVTANGAADEAAPRRAEADEKPTGDGQTLRDEAEDD